MIEDIIINLFLKFSSIHFPVDNVKQVYAKLLLNTKTLLVGAVYILPNTQFFKFESFTFVLLKKFYPSTNLTP